MNSINNKSIICCAVVLATILACLLPTTNARLLRRPIYNDQYGYGPSAYDNGYGQAGVATGERAIIKVRGARHPIDGSAPQKLAIEDDPYRGPVPRGIYDNVDNYGGRGGYPFGGANFMQQASYGGYDKFMRPDFGVRARLNMASNRPSKCRFSTEADSEILELGLDTGRLNVDCDLNPIRMANAAIKVAKKYHKNRKNYNKKRKHAKNNGDYKTIRSTTKTKVTRVTKEKKKYRQPDNDDY